MQRPPIDATDRARRLGNVAALLIDLGRKARLAAEAAESAKSGKSADDVPTDDVTERSEQR